MAETGVVEHETSDMRARMLAALAGGLSAFVVAVAVATRLGFPAVADDRDRGPHDRPAGIQLQVDARGDLLAYRQSHAAEVAAVDLAMRRLADDEPRP
ncbi:MAG: hypothetical protein ACRYG4_05675 [Janthinobacterium lividum]